MNNEKLKVKSLNKFPLVILCIILVQQSFAQTLTAKDMSDKVTCGYSACFDSLFVKRGFVKMPNDMGVLSLIETVFLYKSVATIGKGKTDSLSRNYIELDLFNSIGEANRLVFTTRSKKVYKKLLKSFEHEGFVKYSSKPNNIGDMATIYQNKNPYLELVCVEAKHKPEDIYYEFILIYNNH